MTNGYAAEVQELYAGRTVYNGGVIGQTSPQIRARMVADTAKHTWTTVLWAGHNDFLKPPVKDEIAAMVQALVNAGNNKWCIVTTHNWSNDGAFAAPLATAKVAEVGHSLVNQTMPAHLVAIAQGKGKTATVRAQVIGASSLKNSWDNHTSAETSGSSNPSFGSVYDALTVGNAYDTFVCTELVIPPLPAQSETLTYLANWRGRALAAKSDARLFYYTTWAGDGDRAVWYTNTGNIGNHFEQVIDTANASIGSGQPRWAIIPGHLAMRRLYESIGSGAIGWALGGINYFFSDGFHLNARGNYFIACVQFASIYRASPIGAPIPSGVDLTSGQAAQLQELAWTVVSTYGRNGFPADTEHARVMQLNSDLAALYPGKIVDIRSYLKTQGNGSNDDKSDIAADLVPRSLRWPNDTIHLNEQGNEKAAAFLKAFLDAKGW